MSAIDQVFSELRKSNRKALMPFITAGDPDLAFTSQVLLELAKRGCSLCELGIPYSDPVADGPVIQESYNRALQNHVQLGQIFDTIGSVTSQVTMPVVTMVSYSIIYRRGVQKYLKDAAEAGVAGLIVPDLPVEEGVELLKLCRAAGLDLIQLVAPTTPRERAVRIAENSSGFLYYISVAGITGERTEMPAELVENVGWLREQTSLPICIGFGISQPEHVQRLKPVADGLIVGSAVVRRMAEFSEGGREQTLKSVGDYVASLLQALESD